MKYSQNVLFLVSCEGMLRTEEKELTFKGATNTTLDYEMPTLTHTQAHAHTYPHTHTHMLAIIDNARVVKQEQKQ